MDIPLLTSGESKVYQALIELGESPIGNIIKTSKVSHSKIYDILKRLSEKGLVSAINKNGRQHFSAADPERLSHLIAERKEQLEETARQIDEIVPRLKIRKDTSSPLSVLSAYEGIKGMKGVLDYIITTLKKDEEILILGAPKRIGDQLGGYLKDWQKRRIKSGAVCRMIGDVDAPSWDDEWWRLSKKNKRTFSKRSKSISPSYLVITKDAVITIYFSTKILTFVVEHSDVAQRYVKFFNELWKNA